MKRYQFELVVHEGKDEFWESLEGTGCDQVQDMVVEALKTQGLYTGTNCDLVLRQFNGDSERHESGLSALGQE